MLVAISLGKYVVGYSVAAMGAYVLAALLHSGHDYVTVLFPLVIIALAGFFTLRSNVAKIYRDAYEAKEEQVKVAHEQTAEAKTALAAAEAQVATLREQLAAVSAQTDLTPVVGKLEEIAAELKRNGGVRTALARHEEQAALRAERLLALLQLIADRLGPDPNGGNH